MPRAVPLVMMLLPMAAWHTQAHATDDRSLLVHCKALVAQPQASTASEDGELRRCQQIIREWTLARFPHERR